METYKVLSEFNAFLQETHHYIIRVRGNERFIDEVEKKLPEESGFSFAEEELTEDQAKTLCSIGNMISVNTRYHEYRLIDKVPDQKVVELGFIETGNDLLNFLTIGRFLGDRETSKIHVNREEKVKGNGQSGKEVKGKR